MQKVTAYFWGCSPTWANLGGLQTSRKLPSTWATHGTLCEIAASKHVVAKLGPAHKNPRWGPDLL